MSTSKYIVPFSLILFLTSFSSGKAAIEQRAPGHYMINSADAVEIGTTLQFTPMKSEPVACAERLLGTVSLTSALRFCVCDGSAWKFESTGERCNWKAGRAGDATPR